MAVAPATFVLGRAKGGRYLIIKSTTPLSCIKFWTPKEPFVFDVRRVMEVKETA